ncbi:hypothetical protein DPMN_038831 [Dreissena polymorpha]|uniref:Uncharacterized protein n=1 Tax=Dreissena polymorpha TaxID=45954 RepID=A0A9D4RQQ5_DREPO|nr:hypothetical protein DPMN_038831 [Dreissena polymorpha]
MVWFFERESKKLRLCDEGNDGGEVVNISACKKLSFIDVGLMLRLQFSIVKVFRIIRHSEST